MSGDADNAAQFSALNFQADRLASWAAGWATVLLAGVVLIIWSSRSPFMVGLSVVLGIGAVAFYGYYRLALARAELQRVTDEFRVVAQAVADDAAAALRSGLSAGAERPTPSVGAEIEELLRAEVTPGLVHACVDRLLGPVRTQLAQVSFVRTVLVLAGLFGTVLFFSRELSSQVAGGDLDALLPGLRGALASTLSGILGSVTIGFALERPRRIADQLHDAAETFLLGPLRRAVQTRPAPQQVATEIDLWVALADEVATLRDSTAVSAAKMGDDAHSLALTMQQVAAGLAALPHVDLPPELKRLEESVTKFRDGTQRLWDTIEVLVPLVRSLGVEIPARVFEQLDSAVKASEQSALASTTAAEQIRTSLADDEALRRELRAHSESLRESALTLKSDAKEAREEFRQRLDSLEASVQSGNGVLDGVLEVSWEHARMLGVVRDIVDTSSQALDTAAQSREEHGRLLTTLQAGVETGNQALETAARTREEHGRLIATLDAGFAATNLTLETAAQAQQEHGRLLTALQTIAETSNEALARAAQTREEHGRVLTRIATDVAMIAASDAAERQLRALEGLVEKADRTGARNEAACQALEQAGSRAGAASAELGERVRELAEQTEEVRRASDTLSQRSDAISHIDRAVTGISIWHERLRRAPLVRLLTFTLPAWPWWGPRSLPPDSPAT
jgi:hypothetical protein